jgi:hypothetical protein
MEQPEQQHALVVESTATDTRHRMGETPVHYAVRYNRAINLRYLVKSGADISIRGKDGKRPIDLIEDRAAQAEIVELLTTAELEPSRALPWKEIKVSGKIPLFRFYCSAALFNDRLYLFGGQTRQSLTENPEYLNDMHMLLIHSYEWCVCVCVCVLRSLAL